MQMVIKRYEIVEVVGLALYAYTYDKVLSEAGDRQRLGRSHLGNLKRMKSEPIIIARFGRSEIIILEVDTHICCKI